MDEVEHLPRRTPAQQLVSVIRRKAETLPNYDSSYRRLEPILCDADAGFLTGITNTVAVVTNVSIQDSSASWAQC